MEENKIEFVQDKIKDLEWKVKYHTKELFGVSSELEMWSEKLVELTKQGNDK